MDRLGKMPVTIGSGEGNAVEVGSGEGNAMEERRSASNPSSDDLSGVSREPSRDDTATGSHGHKKSDDKVRCCICNKKFGFFPFTHRKSFIAH